jgi:hypothetical protein
MTRQMVTQTIALILEQVLKIFLMTGAALSAVLEKKISTRNKLLYQPGSPISAAQLFFLRISQIKCQDI